MANIKHSFFRSLWQKLYKLYAVRDNVTLGRNVHIGIGTILWAPNSLIVGNDVYIGKNCTIEVDGQIGNDVLIANLVGIVGKWDHDYTVVGTPMSKTPWIGDNEYTGKGKSGTITINDDVWVGYGAILLSGIEVGRGAIIAAGAVVTKNVEPYTIVAGVPAMKIGMRFTELEIVDHEKK
jgi:acetyltransferase-like isoleucine patch superfamily enzyme